VLLISPYPLQPGVVVRARPLGVLEMEDEAGVDAKLVAVPVSKLTPIYDDLQDVEDLPQGLRNQIKHFFEHYKDLEKGKWVKVKDWQGVEAARTEILASVKRYETSK
jgi:inorganic pyrophosphatase